MSSRRSLLTLALAVLTGISLIAMLAIPASGVSLRNEGIRFPDGSIQTTAVSGPGDPVQASALLEVGPSSMCSDLATLYPVPPGKWLMIEWVSVEVAGLGPAFSPPVDIEVRTRSESAQLTHPLVRLSDPDGLAPVYSEFWQAPVRLYSVESEDVEFRACRTGDSGSMIVAMTFSGRLFDAAT